MRTNHMQKSTSFLLFKRNMFDKIVLSIKLFSDSIRNKKSGEIILLHLIGTTVTLLGQHE